MVTLPAWVRAGSEKFDSAALAQMLKFSVTFASHGISKLVSAALAVINTLVACFSWGSDMFVNSGIP